MQWIKVRSLLWAFDSFRLSIKNLLPAWITDVHNSWTDLRKIILNDLRNKLMLHHMELLFVVISTDTANLIIDKNGYFKINKWHMKL